MEGRSFTNPLILKKTNLAELVLKAAENLPRPASVELRFESALEDPVAEVDAAQLTRILVNLMQNALEAMPEGGELALGLSGGPDEVILDIADTGRGICDEHMDQLFVPFFTTKKTGEGSGMSLPFALGIVKLHDGKITVTSNADPAKGPTGSRFRISLPRHRKLRYPPGGQRS
jgi:signal transduction histidine kinase